MAKRLKFREPISEAEHYFCKHCTTMYIGGYVDKFRKRKHNEKIIMNSTHITYELIYNMCYLIIFFFRIAIKKIFSFYPSRRNPKAIRRWDLEILREEIQERNDFSRAPGVKWLCKSSRRDMTVQELQEWNDWASDQDVTWLGQSSRRDTTGQELKKCQDWSTASEMTWLGKSSRSDMTEQELQKWHDWALFPYFLDFWIWNFFLFVLFLIFRFLPIIAVFCQLLQLFPFFTRF